MWDGGRGSSTNFHFPDTEWECWGDRAQRKIVGCWKSQKT